MKKTQKLIKKFNFNIVAFLESFFLSFRGFLGRDLVKNFLILIIFYLLVSFYYSLYTGIGIDKFYDKQIEKQLKKDIGEKRYEITVLKKDLKGLGSESIIIFLGYPWNNGSYDNSISYSGSKIMIYDKVQKNSLESLLFSSDLYQKNYELEFFPGYQESEYYSDYGIDFIRFFEIQGGVGIQRQDMSGVSSTTNYYGILSYSWSNSSYEINSLLANSLKFELKEALDCFQYQGDDLSQEEKNAIQESYKLCKEQKVNLFNNEIVHFSENNKPKEYQLTALGSDNVIKFIDTKEIAIFYSLRGIIDNKEIPNEDEQFESHYSAHNYLEIRYNKNGSHFSNYNGKYILHYNIDWIKLDELIGK